MVVRRIWCDAAAGDYAREAVSFPGLRLLARVDVETKPRAGEPTTETRYFAASLDPGRVPPARLLGLVRGHWQVENGLHYEKDRGGTRTGTSTAAWGWRPASRPCCRRR